MALLVSGPAILSISTSRQSDISLCVQLSKHCVQCMGLASYSTNGVPGQEISEARGSGD